MHLEHVPLPNWGTDAWNERGSRTYAVAGYEPTVASLEPLAVVFPETLYHSRLLSRVIYRPRLSVDSRTARRGRG